MLTNLIALSCALVLTTACGAETVSSEGDAGGRSAASTGKPSGEGDSGTKSAEPSCGFENGCAIEGFSDSETTRVDCAAKVPECPVGSQCGYGGRSECNYCVRCVRPFDRTKACSYVTEGDQVKTTTETCTCTGGEWICK
jgi:hypothetical protein